MAVNNFGFFTCKNNLPNFPSELPFDISIYNGANWHFYEDGTLTVKFSPYFNQTPFWAKHAGKKFYLIGTFNKNNLIHATYVSQDNSMIMNQRDNMTQAPLWYPFTPGNSLEHSGISLKNVQHGHSLKESQDLKTLKFLFSAKYFTDRNLKYQNMGL